MKTELDDRYLCLKKLDVRQALTGKELSILQFLLDRVQEYRKMEGKRNKMFVIVSENMRCYPKVKQMVLDELNATTD